MPPFDSLIVGGGPAGLAIAERLQRERLAIRMLEKGAIADHISQYPTFMRFFSTNANLEIAEFPLQCAEEKPSRQEYLAYLAAFARFHRLPVDTWTEVTDIIRDAGTGNFTVAVRRINGAEEMLTARSVVLAVGAFANPRRLNVPGEDLPHVHRRFTEVHPYIGRRVAVIGGRNSAVETALLLWRAGAEVTLIHRGAACDGFGVKYWLKPDIENRIANGEIRGLLSTRLQRIEPGRIIARSDDGTTHDLPMDFVIPMVGYDPPVAFLRKAGVELEADSNRPLHDPETLETTVPGLYVAGVITAGNISGHVFIENSRHHGDLILRSLLPRLELASRR